MSEIDDLREEVERLTLGDEQRVRDLTKYITRADKAEQRVAELEVALLEAQRVIEDMRGESRLHGHVTDASARYLLHVKPQIDAALREPRGRPHAVECHLGYAEEFPKDHDIECEGECNGCDCWKPADAEPKVCIFSWRGPCKRASEHDCIGGNTHPGPHYCHCGAKKKRVKP